MTAHLGERISALVDGQLPPEETEAALEHVVACEECAQALAAERDFRRSLAQARDVEPTEDLTDRLVQLAHAPVPPAPRGVRGAVSRVREPLSHRHVRRRLATHGTVLLGAASCALGLLLLIGSVFQRTGDPLALLDEASGPVQRPVQISPAAAAETLGAPGESETATALDWLREHGWPAPERLPVDARIELVGTVEADGEEVVVIEVTRYGRSATVVEQRGVLDAETRAALEEVDLGRHEVHRLPGPGSTLVFESAGTTVLVTSSEDSDLVHAIAAAMPATEPGGGMGHRFDQGWETLVEWTDVLLHTR